MINHREGFVAFRLFSAPFASSAVRLLAAESAKNHREKTSEPSWKLLKNDRFLVNSKDLGECCAHFTKRDVASRALKKWRHQV